MIVPRVISGPRCRRRPRDGIACVYLIFLTFLATALASLAIDWGHVQLVKTELQVAADAGALYAGGCLPDAAAAVARANAALPSNAFDGRDLLGTLSTTLPPGTYVVRDFTLLANVSLRVVGPTTVYVTGTTNLLGSLLVAGNDPANLRIWVAGSSPVTLVANVATYADLYAPQSPVRVLAGLGYYGRIVGRTVDVLGTSLIHYDEALGAAGPPAKVRLAR